MATVDVLGEELRRADEARAIARAYVDVLAAIERERLDANISVKLTGARAPARPGALPRAARAGRRRRAGARQLRPDRHGGLVDDRRRRCGSTAGCARAATTTSASSSRRTCGAPPTTCARSPTCGRASASCKGIYVEPPELAFRDPEHVRASFARLLDQLLDARLLRRHRDARRVGDQAGARADRAAAARAGRLRVPDAARRPRGPPRRSSSAPATACASTSRSARTGTRTRCGGCRRTRASPATSPATRSAGCCRSAECGPAVAGAALEATTV